jgi:uncharacterized protein (TIGR02646 family)
MSRAESERAKAIAFFTNGAGRPAKKKFIFRVYRDAELVRALEAALGRKCVYCESRFAHVTPKDIEHFRPKSEIERRGQPTLVPGYFWLASDWLNLLISCPDCNRARQHEVPGQTSSVLLGKQAQFPLRDESLRVRRHTGSVDLEEPARLLLNPCIDDPEAHLTFDELGLVHPAADGHGIESEMGATSISIYALQRKLLVEERLRVLNDLRVAIAELRDVVIDIGELRNAPVRDPGQLQRKENQLQRMRLHIGSFTGKQAPYLAMVRGYIRRQKRAGEFKDLLTAPPKDSSRQLPDLPRVSSEIRSSRR